MTSEVWAFSYWSKAGCEAERDDSNVDDPAFWTGVGPDRATWHPTIAWVQARLDEVAKDEGEAWDEEGGRPTLSWVSLPRDGRDFCWELRAAGVAIGHARVYPIAVD